MATSVGIIMDGNRRWAAKENITAFEGHKKGINKLFEVARWIKNFHVRHLVVYAFSTENWNRSAEEVSFLMDLIREGIRNFSARLKELNDNKTCVRFIGQRTRLAPDIQDAMLQVEKQSAPIDDCSFTMWICLSYGGRLEIIEAAKKLHGTSGEITEQVFREALWTAEMPDPDLIIRTGGEMRLSGFLTYASVYSELFFVPTLWPDFSLQELVKVLLLYSSRERRFGL